MGQNFLSWLKRAKNASADLSAVPVFLWMVSLKKTLLLEGRCNVWESREAKAEIRSGQVNANRVTTFIEIALSDTVLFFPKDIMYLIIKSTFQVWEYLSFIGR